jgi:DNA-directed RNA polymerase specialized sigma24 family protein
VRACYAEARRTPRWLPNLIDGSADEPHATDAYGGVVHRDELERGFRRLPLDQRAVVVLHHYLDLPLAEVAGALGIPLGTAHSRLNRAMNALRAALAADARPTVFERAAEGTVR